MTNGPLNDVAATTDFTRNPLLAIVVIGASGDLAKRKTYPSLFSLYQRKLLPSHTIVWGYSRSRLTHDSLREQIRPFLQASISESPQNEELLQSFLNMCFYQRGTGYDDINAYRSMHSSIGIQKKAVEKCLKDREITSSQRHQNHLFYLAIPPNLFHTATQTITQSFATIPQDSLRILFEKPFGRDTESYLHLSNSLSKLPGIHESQMLRIDHYLGKDMIRAIPSLRFNNPWARAIWNRKYISHIVISMKETIGTAGRGGYFDQYGVIRDIIQNHLLQVMTLVAMEEPETTITSNVEGMRDAKCRLLEDVKIPTREDCVVGQYVGYKDDEQVPDESCTPTFAVIKLFVDNERWRGVPFVLLAGKSLEEKSSEIRVVFRSDIGSRNELTIRIQPENEISLTTNVAGNDYGDGMKQETMVLNLKKETEENHMTNADGAYSKLIYDALKGNSSSFVRDDELRLSWEICTPLLHQIEKNRPYPYEIGSRGPPQAQRILDNDDHHHGRSRL